jgi:lactoylglutathione lyase
MAGTTPGKTEFSNVRVLASDFARSWKFYLDVLGLTPRKGHGEPPCAKFVPGDRTVVGMFEQKLMAEATALGAAPYPTSVVGRSALILETSDVDAVAKELERRNVPLVRGPTDRPAWQLRTIHLQDPNGYLIEIFSPLPA